MEIEKEVRYEINNDQKKKIIDNTTPFKKRMNMLDITCGYDGFNSYSKYKFICRIRQKGRKKTLEVKNYYDSNECVEQSINLKNVKDGLNYLVLIGMKPYLYLKRYREVRKYKGLKIFIDEFDILGNYVEIEYQDSKDAVKELKEFMSLINIADEPQDMYGAIVRKRLEEDKEFKKIFDKKLDNILASKQ